MVVPVSMCGQPELELSRDGSHYSLSTGILPALGARSSRRVKLRPFVLSPYDRRYRFLLLIHSLSPFCFNFQFSFLFCFWFSQYSFLFLCLFFSLCVKFLFLTSTIYLHYFFVPLVRGSFVTI